MNRFLCWLGFHDWEGQGFESVCDYEGDRFGILWVYICLRQNCKVEHSEWVRDDKKLYHDIRWESVEKEQEK